MTSELDRHSRAQGDLVLEVRDLRVETDGGVEIVDEVALELDRGRVLGLVGESGCGKTSTALAMLGHARNGTRIAGGSVRLNGVDLLRLAPAELRRVRGAQIAYVPQDPSTSLNPRHRVGAQVLEALVAHGEAAGPERTTATLMERVGLPAERSFLRRFPFELSGGQQQRIAIAMAIATRPAVVVLDEPTTGLDVTTQARILELIRDLSTETGVSFLYVSHDLAVVDGLADDIAVMYAGRVVESGTREQVFNTPAHPYTALLLAAVPRLSERTHLEGIPGTAPRPGSRPEGCSFAARCPLAVEELCGTAPGARDLGAGHRVRCWRPSALSSVRQRSPRAIAAAGAAPDPVLSVQGLVAAHGHGRERAVVLDGVSFDLERRECLAVVGESGSGKTTLARCITGLHSPDDGMIALADRQLARRAEDRTASQRRAIQIVFQNPERSLNPTENVGDTIERPLRLFGMSDRGARRRRRDELLSRVRLPSTATTRYPRELSGGERQRLAVARALAAEPTVLVCDEITSALDVSIQAAIISLLEDLRAEIGLSMLFVTHDLAVVNAIADRVMVLQHGQVREAGTVSAVLETPRDPYTRALIGAVPELRAPAVELPAGDR